MFRSCRTLSQCSWRGRNFMTEGPNSFVEVSPIATKLTALDYPLSFRGLNGKVMYAHNDDYKITSSPIKPEVFLYCGEGGRNRLFFRTSIMLTNPTNNITFTSATFLLDSGCGSHFILSHELRKLICSRIKFDDHSYYILTEIGGSLHNCKVVSDLPNVHPSVNVMGISMFFPFVFHFKKGRMSGLEFDEENVAHNVATFSEFKYL